jgi:hypothetical protein
VFISTQSIHHAHEQAIPIDDGRRQKYNDFAMKQKGLSRLENLVQDLVEGTFGRLFGGHLEPVDVVNHLVKAIEDNDYKGQGEVNYQVYLNPDDYRALIKSNPALAQIVADTVQKLGFEMGTAGSNSPQVRLMADPALRRRRMNVGIRFVEAEEDDQATRTYRHRQQGGANLRKMHERDAFLILQGRKHIPLNQPIISLGRRIDNDIVLDHPSVSRQQAQIRWRLDSFILYDVSGRGRTLVNGHIAHERVLRPGDVIALGEVLIVYGEGIASKASLRSKGSEDNQTLARLPKKQ